MTDQLNTSYLAKSTSHMDLTGHGTQAVEGGTDVMARWLNVAAISLTNIPPYRIRGGRCPALRYIRYVETPIGLNGRTTGGSNNLPFPST